MLEKKEHWNLKYQTQDPTNIKKPDYTLVKYLRVFVSQKTTKTVFFLNILQKDHQLRILGTLKMSGHFH